MDTRINPYRILNLSEGDVHILHNAGGIITDDILRSLIISQRLLNTIEFILIPHTKCDMKTFKEDEVKVETKREIGEQPNFEFGTFKDVHENVDRSIVALKQNPFLTCTVEVHGFVYDVDLDQLEEVHSEG